ncbi:MAG: patatin-like phospholipase family protein [Rhodanobacteraceae bacterium]
MAGDEFDMRKLLHGLPLFMHLDEASLDELADELEWFALPGGARLFDHGDPSDSLYVLKSGRLGAFKPDAEGVLRLDGVVAAGESVGELGLIVDQPRSATVRALRDSELLRLSRAGFQHLVERHPNAILTTARLVVRRLIEPKSDATLSAPRTFAILPHHGVDARNLSRRLGAALGRYGECVVIDADAGRGRTSDWFSALEARVRHVLYLGEAQGDADWSKLCVRQADCLLLPVRASQRASAWPQSACLSAARVSDRPRHLLLLRDGEIETGAAARWLTEMPGAQHHHVHDDRDIERIARLLTGRSVGLVLSGGGARGFAHIGVVRALREAGIKIDSVGGSSIGAIIGAGVAADWSDEEIFETYRREFVVARPLSDYTFPFISMTAGRRVSKGLRESFGARDITDLALPFFCTTANLTAGCAETRSSGPLWFWLRASCAIPGVLPPVFHRGEVFVDGAVMNNLPVDAMRARGIGEIIAVDIGADDVLHAEVEEHALPAWPRLAWDRLFNKHRRPGILSILLRSGMVNAEVASRERRALTSLLLTPPLSDIELFDWHAYERAIDAGYIYTQQRLARANSTQQSP